MFLTEKQAEILRVLAAFYLLVRRQVQRLVYPNHKQGRKTRDQLATLVRDGFIGKTTALVPYLGSVTGSPCFYLKDKGRRAVAEYYGDETLLLASVRPPRGDRLLHWLGISENHLRVKLAIDAQNSVRLATWVNEWNRYRPDAADVDDYFLKVVFTENPPLSCSPDAAMVLEVLNVSKAFYWEVDRATSAEEQVAASKWRGYHELAVRGWHRERHFPTVTGNDFSVIVVTTTPWRRDRLARAFAKYDGAHRYLFCVQEELQPATFLHTPITINCQGVAAPLAKPQTPVDATIRTDNHQPVLLAASTSTT
jgi:hypothetical protein